MRETGGTSPPVFPLAAYDLCAGSVNPHVFPLTAQCFPASSLRPMVQFSVVPPVFPLPHHLRPAVLLGVTPWVGVTSARRLVVAMYTIAMERVPN